MKLLIKYSSILLIVIVGLITGCDEDYLDRNPLNQISEAIFWSTSEDARLALNGVYNRDGNWRSAFHIAEFFTNLADNSVQHIPSRYPMHVGAFAPTNTVGGFWNGSYQQITKCHHFLENIDKVEMDAGLKNQYIAEVRFFRAWEYYNLVQWFGSVPLVKKVLTMEEANSVSVDPKDEIVEFILNELDAVIPDLPVTRPSAEHGRIVRGAAYGVKARLLMAEERWSEAAAACENLINLGVHSIDPDYRGLFDGSNEESTENIFVSKYLESQVWHPLQLNLRPHTDGGWAHVLPTKDLVDSYLCQSGEPIEECEIYQNAENFHEEFLTKEGEFYRDPRLYMTVYIDGIHQINGVTYYGHPDRTSSGDEVGYNLGNTGYVTRKYVDEEYVGNIYEGGNDIPIIRYAEVLLNYLESKIKAGDVITQDLLDNTINMLRLRESVNIPPVIREDYGSAMDLWDNCVKRERRVELALEGLRLWDLIRWGESETLVDRTYYGMKLTENPEEYDAFDIDKNGYARIYTKLYKDYYHPWPIPQSELDINTNLQQKDNWVGR